MRTERTLHLSYTDEAGKETQRPVWPVTLAYYEDKHIIGAWCTLRNDFRNFRIDRVRDARLGDEPFGRRRVILLKEWEAVWSERTSRREDTAS
jgi:predicted DNA-binding transcriptional regulator YafY